MPNLKSILDYINQLLSIKSLVSKEISDSDFRSLSTKEEECEVSGIVGVEMVSKLKKFLVKSFNEGSLSVIDVKDIYITPNIRIRQQNSEFTLQKKVVDARDKNLFKEEKIKLNVTNFQDALIDYFVQELKISFPNIRESVHSLIHKSGIDPSLVGNLLHQVVFAAKKNEINELIGRILEKNRFVIELNQDLTLDLDVYYGRMSGFIKGDYEFRSYETFSANQEIPDEFYFISRSITEQERSMITARNTKELEALKNTLVYEMMLTNKSYFEMHEFESDLSDHFSCNEVASRYIRFILNRIQREQLVTAEKNLHSSETRSSHFRRAIA